MCHVTARAGCSGVRVVSQQHLASAFRDLDRCVCMCVCVCVCAKIVLAVVESMFFVEALKLCIYIFMVFNATYCNLD